MIGTLNQVHPDPFRASTHTRQPMTYPRSRDQPASLEYDIPAQSTSRFPISSVRPEVAQNCGASLPAHPPKPIYPRHDPLHILSQPTTPAPAPPSYPTVRPASQVAPGVLEDGVLTAKLPSVRNFLAAAAIAPPECPPLPTDRRVLALVALSVFYHPLHPAHWAFWNKQQKMGTATLIQDLLNTTPMPILSPIAWIDITENLWLLRSMQLAYAPALTSLPWYAAYTPAEPENRMNLRKRKAPVILASAAIAASGDDTVDEEERLTPPPPRKRAKTRKSGASRPSLAASAKAKSVQAEMDEPKEDIVSDPLLLLTPDEPAPASITKAAKRERIESPALVIAASAQDESVQPEPPEVPEIRKSLRQRDRKAKTTSTASPASIASTLTPPVRTRRLSQPQAQTPSRESSTSSVSPESFGGAESGSSTAVSLCDEEAAKPSSKPVEEVLDEVADVEEIIDEPAAKRARTARPRAKTGSRAKASTQKELDTPDENKTNTTAQGRPKARSRAKTRRR
ncbi:hypothetical protein HYDPIDRAFT_107587 [Hydnomerulius pinastri MD-312]|nr:hypothetical protein HYDPIDRAFT_107587 [Hydnomerulius pinastri MD-312]